MQPSHGTFLQRPQTRFAKVNIVFHIGQTRRRSGTRSSWEFCGQLSRVIASATPVWRDTDDNDIERRIRKVPQMPCCPDAADKLSTRQSQINLSGRTETCNNSILLTVADNNSIICLLVPGIISLCMVHVLIVALSVRVRWPL